MSNKDEIQHAKENAKAALALGLINVDKALDYVVERKDKTKPSNHQLQNDDSNNGDY